MSKGVIKQQVDWIASGKIGCVFASALVKVRDEILWHFEVDPEDLFIAKSTFIKSIIFPKGNIESVREWALKNGFYIEDINDMYEGLRIKIGNSVAWVQYFGPDSHVLTRQAPYPMLSFTCKITASAYWRVGYHGILHLAHASVRTLTERKQETLWNQSEIKTAQILGHKPTDREAAKVTFLKE